ncbi:FxSxx-COOH system tetratricopeptide repeat protein [Micromonospora sp. WMMD975]|uniref:FxSxx-COOH system tetratricopeptide repeat protein n=1 Tax=Micromonospora sp. WMMD975 TaxID=3016087 RepID=UPI00249C5678|nr:FxSxx-COOH system tetratricopeptide repeat protein [Micromonospora sp. WMMD975]WFE36003.1 FxSxx-COOH system tetratricopeptide repeat protein [Micromonospora sp. WMMD975]
MGADVTEGRIVTFYSYKGGTGRSMALANMAWILASNGHRVLVVDWDLEAPGLHRYFHPFLPDTELTSTTGLMDMFWNYAAGMVDPSLDNREEWREKHADVLEYAVSLRHRFALGGFIDLLSAGRQDRSYASRAMSFDWDNFYDRLHGGSFIDEMRDSMRRHYDYVLIDSRTGLNDTSGICTVQLPDILVICFTLNNQSVTGALAVADSVRRQRADRELRILPVPSRVEDGEKARLETARSYVRHGFRRFLDNQSREERDRYWGDVEIPYKIFYAYEEILASVGDRPHQEGTLLAAYERLTARVTDGRVTEAAPLGEVEREALVRRFWRQTVGVSLYDFFLSHHPADRKWAEWIAAELEEAGYRVSVGSRDLRPGARWSEEIEKIILSSDVTLALLSPAALRSPDVARERQLAHDIDPGGEAARLVPVQVVECRMPAGLGDLNGIRLVGIDEKTAHQRLLSAIRLVQPRSSGHHPRREPATFRDFPGRLPKIFNAPPRPKGLVGREDEIFELWSGFEGLRGGAQVVCGPAGVGKTALALEFVYRFAPTYDAVWWISVGSRDDIVLDISELAVALGGAKGHDLHEPLRELMYLLDGRRCLMILDNVEDVRSRFAVAPPPGVDVLITSRLQAWGSDVVRHELPVLSSAESVELLRRIEPDLSEGSAREVAGLLGGLPLALRMVATDSTLAAQLRDDSQQRSFGNILAPAWKWTRQRLWADEPAAVELLRVVAFFAPEPIPVSLFVDTPAAADHPGLRYAMTRGSNFEELLARLHDYSMVERDEDWFRVHPLVQATVREELTAVAQESYRRQGERLLVSARLGDPVDARSWPRYRRLLPHVVAADWAQGQSLRALVLLLCGYLAAAGEIDRARSLSAEVVERFTVLLGANHRDTVAALHTLAAVTWQAGDGGTALDLAGQVWTQRGDLLGPEHGDTLAALNNFAVMLWSQGRHQEALNQNEELLTRRRETLGPDHPDTLVALGNRATMLFGVGRLPEAFDCERIVHDMRLRRLGAHHPLTLASLENIASIKLELGEKHDAAETYELLVERYGALLGSDHPDALRAMFLSARARQRLGEVTAAQRLLAEALSRQQRVLPAEHPQLAATRELLHEIQAAMSDQERTGT